MNPVASLFSQEIPILIGAAIFVFVAKFRFERRKISIEVSEEALAINDVVSLHECQIPAAQRTMPRSLPVDFREIFPVLNDNARFVPLLCGEYEKYFYWHGFIGNGDSLKREAIMLHIYERLITEGKLRKGDFKGLNRRSIYRIGFSELGMLPIFMVYKLDSMESVVKPDTINILMSQDDTSKLLLSLLSFSPASGMLLSYLSLQNLSVQVV
ncbi:MAG: hypothetical protein ACP5MK_00045 [Candidatus Micrarchaeia archaeon]